MVYKMEEAQVVTDNPNILVTGGAGYVGSQVCKALARSGYTPIALDNLSTGKAELVKWGPLIHADLKDIKALHDALMPLKFDAVIHLAASVDVRESMANPNKYWANNTMASKNLLNVLSANHPKAPLIFSSSGTVYGVTNQTVIKESHPTKPISSYGQSKLDTEMLLKELNQNQGWPSIIFRYFNVAGADPEGECGEWHDQEAHLIPRAIDAAINGTNINIYGTNFPTPDGTAVRDYLHVHDLARAHIHGLKWLQLNPTLSLTVNLGSRSGQSVKEVLDGVERITTKSILRNLIDRQPGDPPSLIADISKAEQELGWTPDLSHDLDKIIGDAYRWRLKVLKRNII